MKIESNSAEETFALENNAEKRQQQVRFTAFTVIWESEKPYLQKDLRQDLESKNQSVVRPLLFYRYTMREDFHFITLMCTASVTRKKCTKLVLKNISREKASALSSGRT